MVGYIRHTFKVIAEGSFGECAVFSKEHLDLPDFDSLSTKLRAVAESEIFELVKDGGLLPDNGREFIGMVQAGNYTQCWQLANAALRRRDPGYDAVDPIDIKPEWLV